MIHAQQDSISQGVTYLLSTQNPDGSWSQDPQVFLDTYTALETLLLLEGLNTQTSLSLNWVRGQSLNNTDDLAHKIILLSLGGETVDTDITTLLTFQRSDNGWGVDQDFLSDVLDTTLALQALHTTTYPDQTVIDNAINYLINTQNPDGGWGFYQGDTSNIYMTSLVSWTLQRFLQTTSIATAINNATTYLISQQQIDGSWGTVYETAQAYIALVAITTDATVLGSAIDYLTNTQSANGSWNDDAYSTALVLRALQASIVPPPPPPTPVTTGIVTGTVIDKATNQPLSEVSVTLVDAPSITTLTDTNGDFVLSDIPEGSVQVNITKAGYTGLLLSAEVTAEATTDLGTVTLEQSTLVGRVAGTIYGISGQPISGVTVEVAIGTTTMSTVTAGDGSYNITNVPPGEITITASKTGYHPVSGTGNLLPGGVIYFSPALVPLEFSLPPISTGTLKGTVIDLTTSTPLEGVTVTLTGPPTSQDIYVLYVSSLGEGKVIRITPTGETSVVISGFAFNELDNGAVFDTVGNLYINNFASGRVVKITTAGEVSVVASGFGYGGVGQLAFDSEENLYFGNRFGSNVYKVTPDGTVSLYASGFGGAAGIAFDTQGNLYVTNEGRGTISKVTPSGTISTFATGISNPYTLAFDSKDNLYVLSVYGGTLYKVDPNGRVSVFLQGGGESHGLAIDKDDNIYISRYYSRTITEITPQGEVSTFFSGTPDRPTAIAIQQTTEVVTPTLPPVITDPNGDFIIPDIPAGTYEVTINLPGYEPQTFSVTIPAGVTTDIGNVRLTPTIPVALDVKTDRTQYNAYEDVAISLDVTSLTEDVAITSLTSDPCQSLVGKVSISKVSISIEDATGNQVSQLPDLIDLKADSTDPVLMWHMNGDWTDSSGNGNNGVPKSGVSFGEGRCGEAGWFDGRDDWVDIGNSSSLYSTSSIAVSVWINVASLPPGGKRYAIIGNGNNRGCRDPFFITVESSGKVRLVFGTNNRSSCFSSGGYNLYSSSTVSPNQWYRIIASYDKSTGLAKLYIDGQLEASKYTDTSGMETSSYRWSVGRWFDGVYFPAERSHNTYPYHGYIDELIIWNRPITEEELGLTKTYNVVWNTGTTPSGDYKVRAILYDEGGSSLVEDTANFEIIQTINIGSPSVFPTPRFFHVGAFETITVSVAFANRSNVTVDLSIDHEIKDPGGVVIDSGTTTYSLVPEETYANITLATFSHTFTEKGEYSVEVNIFDGSNLLGTATGILSVAPNIRIEPSKTLTPDTVPPDGDKRIRINIRLKGLEDLFEAP